MKSVEDILQDTPIDKIGHLFGDTTRLTYNESFFVMQMFFDDFCKLNDNFDLIQLVQNSRFNNRSDIYNGIPDIIEPEIWNVWQDAIEIAVKKEKDETFEEVSLDEVITEEDKE